MFKLNFCFFMISGSYNDFLHTRWMDVTIKFKNTIKGLNKQRYLFLYTLFQKNNFGVYGKYFFYYSKFSKVNIFHVTFNTSTVYPLDFTESVFKQILLKPYVIFFKQRSRTTNSRFYHLRFSWVARYYKSSNNLKSGGGVGFNFFQWTRYGAFCFYRSCYPYSMCLNFLKMLTALDVYVWVPYIYNFRLFNLNYSEESLSFIEYEGYNDSVGCNLTLKRYGRGVRLYCYLSQAALNFGIKLNRLHIFGLSLFSCIFLFEDLDCKKYSRSLKFIFSFIIRRYLLCLDIFHITISILSLFSHLEDIVKGVLTSNDELIFNSTFSFFISDCIFELEIADIDEEFCFCESDSRETLALFFRYSRRLFGSYYINLWDEDQFILLWYCFCLRFLYRTDFYLLPNKTHQFFISSYIKLHNISYSNSRQLLSFKQIPIKRIKKRITKRLVKLLKYRTWYF